MVEGGVVSKGREDKSEEKGMDRRGSREQKR